VSWGTPIEIERRRRIRVALWAYAYEILDDPFVPDARFDEECLLVQPDMDTGHTVLDRFFRTHFKPYTGQWVRRHPELKKLDRLAGRRLQGKGTKKKV
jgi:hypothetical protein